jgi:hypothetical protein
MRAAIVIGVALAFCAVATATPHALLEQHMRRHTERLHSAEGVRDEWHAPLATDCRSPCPGLNMLANHGLLPHNGKGITAAMLYDNFTKVFGMGFLFAKFFSSSASKKFIDPATGTFDLCALQTSLHSSDQASHQTGVEHYGSMSRLDRPGQDFSKATNPTQRSPTQSQVDMLLSASTDGKMITFDDYVKARRTIWDRTYAAKPWAKGAPMDTTEHMIAAAEGCLMMGLLAGDSNAGKLQISKTYVQSILVNEKFPDGWKRSTRTFGSVQFLMCLAAQGFSWAATEVTAVATLGSKWFGFM